ncbi:MAG: serine/threonine protein kinase, partial [Planctomycetes bacterium]|nr:serine/threonine protein kinase [Planctomycetota bacterium]
MTQHVGPYRLQQSLAKGGGGEVYRALGPGGHIVALKVLRGPFNERRRRRAEVELRAQRRLEHPAILPVLDCGWHDQIAYLVFPLVEGGSLQDRLKREGTLPTATALEVVRQLADGLAHAHAQGVLHRDLKPDNVLLTEAGARLIDFGLAQELEASYSRLTTSGTYLGTPGFWAPEQAQGELERIGPWTDVYGLGATLYACLSSRAPYVADTVGVMLSMLVQRAPPDPLGLLRPDLDPRVVGLCMRCLAFDPEQRPSLPALIQELDALLQGREQGAPRPRRGLGWFAGAAAGCAVLALGAAG